MEAGGNSGGTVPSSHRGQPHLLTCVSCSDLEFVGLAPAGFRAMKISHTPSGAEPSGMA